MNYRIHVPDSAQRPGAPLLVALHGCRQDADDFAQGTRLDEVADRYGTIVLYPEQDERANGHRCWNWFLPENQHRDGPETAEILEIVERVARESEADPRRIFVAGLSAGACMAAILAEQAPGTFAGVGLMAGVALHSAFDAESAYAAMRGEREPNFAALARHGFDGSRAIVWTGIEDNRVDPANAWWLAREFGTLYRLARDPDRDETLADGRRVRWHDVEGRLRIELRELEGIGHAWSGGSLRGSYTAPAGPSFSEAILRFFLEGAPE